MCCRGLIEKAGASVGLLLAANAAEHQVFLLPCLLKPATYIRHFIGLVIWLPCLMIEASNIEEFPVPLKSSQCCFCSRSSHTLLHRFRQCIDMMTTDEALTSVKTFRSQLKRKIKIMNVTRQLQSIEDRRPVCESTAVPNSVILKASADRCAHPQSDRTTLSYLPCRGSSVISSPVHPGTCPAEGAMHVPRSGQIDPAQQRRSPARRYSR
jgi:hypothetical protein